MPFDKNELDQDKIIAEEKQYFINEDNYQRLQYCQQAIAKATDISPSIRKLVNELITTENLEKVKNKLIAFLSDN